MSNKAWVICANGDGGNAYFSEEDNWVNLNDATLTIFENREEAEDTIQNNEWMVSSKIVQIEIDHKVVEDFSAAFDLFKFHSAYPYSMPIQQIVAYRDLLTRYIDSQSRKK
tara:strand:- start:1258 stop:1590 length:333 start_codon:yes stop_codon:yes gene_type:complete